MTDDPERGLCGGPNTHDRRAQVEAYARDGWRVATLDVSHLVPMLRAARKLATAESSGRPRPRIACWRSDRTRNQAWTPLHGDYDRPPSCATQSALRRRCTRPSPRRRRGKSDHQRDARFPRNGGSRPKSSKYASQHESESRCADDVAVVVSAGFRSNFR
jgi:hypothetical protein